MAAEQSFDAAAAANAIQNALASGLQQGLAPLESVRSYIEQLQKDYKKAVTQADRINKSVNNLDKNVDQLVKSNDQLAKIIGSLAKPTPQKGVSQDVPKTLHGILSFTASSDRALYRIDKNLDKLVNFLSVSPPTPIRGDIPAVEVHKIDIKAEEERLAKKLDSLNTFFTNLKADQAYISNKIAEITPEKTAKKLGGPTADDVDELKKKVLEGIDAEHEAKIAAAKKESFKEYASYETDQAGITKVMPVIVTSIDETVIRRIASVFIEEDRKSKGPSVAGAGIKIAKDDEETEKKTTGSGWLETFLKGLGLTVAAFSLFLQDIPALKGTAIAIARFGTVLAGAGLEAAAPAIKLLAKFAPASAGKFLLPVAKFFGNALKAVPFIGGLISLGSAFNRIHGGDYVGGLIDVAAAVTGFVPGVGTALSIALSLLNAGRDLKYGGPAGAAKLGINKSIGEFIGKFLERTAFGRSIMLLADGVNDLFSGNILSGLTKLADGTFGAMFAPILSILDIFQIDDKENPGQKKGLGAIIFDAVRNMINNFREAVIKKVKGLIGGFLDSDEDKAKAAAEEEQKAKNQKISDMSRAVLAEKDPTKKEQLRQEMLKAKYGDNIPEELKKKSFAASTESPKQERNKDQAVAQSVPDTKQPTITPVAPEKTFIPTRPVAAEVATSVKENNEQTSRMLKALEEQNKLLLQRLEKNASQNNSSVVIANNNSGGGMDTSFRDPAYEHRISVYNRLTRDLASI